MSESSSPSPTPEEMMGESLDRIFDEPEGSKKNAAAPKVLVMLKFFPDKNIYTKEEKVKLSYSIAAAPSRNTILERALKAVNDKFNKEGKEGAAVASAPPWEDKAKPEEGILKCRTYTITGDKVRIEAVLALIKKMNESWQVSGKA